MNKVFPFFCRLIFFNHLSVHNKLVILLDGRTCSELLGPRASFAILALLASTRVFRYSMTHTRESLPALLALFFDQLGRWALLATHDNAIAILVVALL